MKLSRQLRFLKEYSYSRHGFKLAALLALMSAPVGHAATLFWDADGNTTTATGGTGTWDLASLEWRNGSSAGVLQAWTDTTGTTDIADFAGTAGTATLGANLGALGLIFDSTGYTVATGTSVLRLGAGGITVNPTTGTTTISGAGGLLLAGVQTWTASFGGTLAVTAPVANGGFTLTTAGGGSTNISGVVGGTGGLTVNSMGVTTLTGNNTYSGATTIGAGVALQIASAATQTYGTTGAAINNGTLYLSPATGTTNTFGPAISGTGVLNQFGLGITSLTGANTYSGATIVTRGLLQFNGANTFSQNTTGITVASGAGINFLGDGVSATVPATAPITLNGPGLTTVSNASRGALNVQGNTKTMTINAPITLGSASVIGAFGIAPTTTLNGAIGGAFALTFNPDGGGGGNVNFNLNGANTFTGGVNLQTGSGNTSTYQIGNVNGLGANANVVTFNAQNTSYSLALQLNGLSPTTGGVNETSNLAAANTARVFVTNNSTANASTLTLNVAGGATYNYYGNLGGTGTGNNNLNIVKTGAGTQELRSPSATLNTYTGTTSVQAGELNVQSTSGLPLGGTSTINGTATVAQITAAAGTGSAVTVTGGARLSFTDHAGAVPNVPNNFTLGGSGVAGNGALNLTNSANFSFLGTVNLASDTTVRSDSAAQTGVVAFTNVVSGAGGLTFFNQTAGTGQFNVALSAANTYAGNTVLTNSGASALPLLVTLTGGNNRLPVTTAVTFGGIPAGTPAGTFTSGATLALDGINQTVAGLATANTAATGQVYSVVNTNVTTASVLTVNNTAANTFNGIIGGTAANNNNVALTKTGAGSLTLTGANTYTGATNIAGGVLAVNGSLAAGSTVTAVGGALGGTGTVNGPVAVNAMGSISPGLNGTGRLTLGNSLALSANSALQFDLTTPNTTSGNDLILVAGTLTLGGTVAFNLNAPLGQTGTYLIAGYNGNPVNTALLVGGTNLAGVIYTFQNDAAALADPATYAHEIDLVVTAVPEPGTYAGVLVCGGVMAWLLRRRPAASRLVG